MTGRQDADFEALLAYLQSGRAFDFTGYKRPSLMRRVARRMDTLGIEGYADYTDYLEVHPEEFSLLFNTILINVTSFFRDATAWETLRSEVVPSILRRKPAPEPIRIWSAGCASGEEAYSLAIMMAEAIGIEQFRNRVKIYATDVDDEALAQARAASYAAKDLEDVDEPLRERYFEPVNGRYVFKTELRRSIMFGRHDLVRDAPISHVDLLACRNTLMYFNAETQARVLTRFHFALDNGGGVLFLGRAELMLSHAHLFQAIDVKSRIFSKIAQPDLRNRLLAAVPARELEGQPAAAPSRSDRLGQLATDESPVPRIIVDAEGVLAMANRGARAMFSIVAGDIGRRLQDLEISHRPVQLASLIEQAYAERRTVAKAGVERHFPGAEIQYLDVAVSPLFDTTGAPLGASVTFTDVTRFRRLQDEVERTRHELQTANEELQSSNEELETTNEELQSSNEELETTNEELQSTNEELETMNEELQSTNEELQTVNEELRQRTEELHSSNAFLEGVLGSLRSAAVVVNQSLNITVWNERAEDLWGLRGDEVQGKSLLNLDIGLPVEPLKAMARACLGGDPHQREIVVDATNRRGKAIRCRISCSALKTPRNPREGAILLIDELP